MLHLQNRNTLIVSDHHEMRELWQRQQSPWSRCQLSCTGYRLNTVGWILGENKCSTASNKKIAECDKKTLSRKRCCRKKAKIRNDVIFKKMTVSSIRTKKAKYPQWRYTKHRSVFQFLGRNTGKWSEQLLGS